MRHACRSLTLIGLAALLGGLFAATAAAQEEGTNRAAPPDTLRVIRVKILGMSCPFCAYGVQQKLQKVDGVESLDVALESGIATLAMEEGADVSNETLKQLIDEAGFEGAAIVRSFESEHEDWNPEEIPRAGGAAAVSDTSGRSEP